MFSTITPVWNRLVAVGAVVTLAAGMSGCATHYAVKVDAIQNPAVKGGQSFRLVTKDPSLPSRDQKCAAEAVTFVRAALESKGLYEAPDPAKADMVVEIEMDVGAQRAKLRPVDDDSMAIGSPSSMQMPMGGPIPVTRGPLAGSAAAQAQQQQMQGQEQPKQNFAIYYVYEKRLTISARETPEAASSDHSPAEIWRVEVTLEDEKTSIASVLPVMAAAAADKIGTDTRSRQNVSISEKDAVVAYVRNGR